MKTIICVVSVVIALFVFACAPESGKAPSHSGNAAQQTAEKQEYFCPMHPQVRSDKPGVCSICQMDLVLPGDEDSHAHGDGAELLSLDARKQVLADVRLIRVERETFEETARAAGELAIAESAQRVIVARASGRIERLFVRQTGEQIRKGQALYEIYSPTLIQAQSDFLLSQKATVSALELQGFAEKARERLSLLGFTDEQIRALEQRGEPQTRVVVYSPFAGTVVRKNVLEGASVQEGAALFETADFSVVWNIAEVYERDAALLRHGDEATVKVNAYPSEEFRGKITMIYPTLTPGNRVVKVRIELPNRNGRLRPGMFTETTFRRNSGLGASAMIAIPEESVVWNGEQAIVWVKEREFEGKSVFRAQAVKLGARAQNGKYPVTAGLQTGDEIAASGGFLMDSERLLRGGSVAKTGKQTLNNVPAESKPPSDATIQVANAIIAAYDEWTEALAQSLLPSAKKAALSLKETVAREGKRFEPPSPRARAAWEKFRAATLGEIPDNIAKIDATNDDKALENLRRRYKIISDELAFLRKNTPRATPLFRAYCPMAFGNRGAYWLTPHKTIRNPYFGEEMLRCGEIKEELTP
jgi:Cu(I)/Ag(I) efflux system membrane fusion protein